MTIFYNLLHTYDHQVQCETALNNLPSTKKKYIYIYINKIIK